jgi:tetratricopeptide (TPR) repeat protein
VKKAALLLIASSLLALPSRADDDRFKRANQEFAAGNFKAAIADYETEVAARRWSANLFYDLGDAYFRNADLGRAILNYKRALQLDPHHPEAEANLRIARDQSRGLELAPTPAERYIASTQTSSWLIGAAGAFWLGVLLLIVRPRRGAVVTGVACLIVSIACVGAAWALENGVRGKGAAIVTGENVEARVATADTARSILTLPAGSEVIILQQRGDWNYAELPNNQRGWIAANAAEKVRL